MRRLWPRSLAGQLILLLLLALVLAQGISLLIFADERRLALRAAGRDEVLGRTATIARLLAKTPPALHEAVLDAASTHRLRFWLAAESAVDQAEDRHHSNRLARRLRSLLETENAPVLVDIRGRSGFWEWDDDWFRSTGRRWFQARGDDDDEERVERGDDRRWHGRHRHDRKRPLSLVVAVGLDDGSWLNAETLIPPAPRGWAAPSLLAMAVMAMLVCAITILVVRRITRPLARLGDGGGSLRPRRGDTAARRGGAAGGPAHDPGLQSHAAPPSPVRRRSHAHARRDQPRSAHATHLAAPARGIRRGRGDAPQDPRDPGRDAAHDRGDAGVRP